MYPFINDLEPSETPATDKVFRKFFDWMVENRERMHSAPKLTEFFRKIITILDVYSPITTWGTGELGHFVKEHADIQSGKAEARLSVPGYASTGHHHWEMRVVPLDIPPSNIPIIRGIYIESDFTEEKYGGKLPRKCIEKKLFLDSAGNIICVDLHSNVSQGNRCRPHLIEVDIARDMYLTEIFLDNIQYFDLLMSSLVRIIKRAITNTKVRLKEQEQAENAMYFTMTVLSTLLNKKK